MATTKVETFLALADEELDAARILFEKHPRQATYQISQAAEKASRAVCEFENIPVGNTHNFGQIAAMLPSDHALRGLINSLDTMSSASTKFRYPDARGQVPVPPSPEQLAARIADVEALISTVRKFVDAKPTPSDTPTP